MEHLAILYQHIGVNFDIETVLFQFCLLLVYVGLITE